jgi:hypothetical protein
MTLLRMLAFRPAAAGAGQPVAAGGTAPRRGLPLIPTATSPAANPRNSAWGLRQILSALDLQGAARQLAATARCWTRAIFARRSIRAVAVHGSGRKAGGLPAFRYLLRVDMVRGAADSPARGGTAGSSIWSRRRLGRRHRAVAGNVQRDHPSGFSQAVKAGLKQPSGFSGGLCGDIGI